jgi:hypothetical protein
MTSEPKFGHCKDCAALMKYSEVWGYGKLLCKRFPEWTLTRDDRGCFSFIEKNVAQESANPQYHSWSIVKANLARVVGVHGKPSASHINNVLRDFLYSGLDYRVERTRMEVLRQSCLDIVMAALDSEAKKENEK